MERITVEQARIALQKHPDNEYLAAIAENELPSYYLDRFIFFRDNYSNELPLRDITGETEIYEGHNKQVYKCQTTYITGLESGLNSAITNDVIKDERLIEAIREFRRRAVVDKFQVGDPKNVERLARVNGILNEVIAYLAPIGTPEQRIQAATFFFT